MKARCVKPIRKKAARVNQTRSRRRLRRFRFVPIPKRRCQGCHERIGRRRWVDFGHDHNRQALLWHEPCFEAAGGVLRVGK